MKGKARKALVVGGGMAGLEAALKIGQAGHEVILVEKEANLGGTALLLSSTFPKWQDPLEKLNLKLEQLKKLPAVEVYTNTEISSCTPNGSGYSLTLRNNLTGEETGVEAQAAVLATGFDYFDARKYGEYGYGTYPGVMISIEFEEMLREWKKGLKREKAPGAVAFIKCVGSRDRIKGYPYSSKICCMYTARQAGMFKELFPQASCYVFYMDYRAAGKDYEEFVRSVMEEKEVRYVRGRPAKVLPYGGKLMVRSEDTLMGVPIEVEVDLVVLAAAAVPKKETLELAKSFAAATNQHGFLEPVDGFTAKAGTRVFFAGGCGFPTDSAGAQQQGAAAAAEVIALFNQD